MPCLVATRLIYLVRFNSPFDLLIRLTCSGRVASGLAELIYFWRPPVVLPFHQLLERQSGVTLKDAETCGVGERGGGRARPRRRRLGVRRGEHQVQGKLRTPSSASSLLFEFEFCSGLTVCSCILPLVGRAGFCRLRRAALRVPAHAGARLRRRGGAARADGACHRHRGQRMPPTTRRARRRPQARRRRQAVHHRLVRTRLLDPATRMP